jgi:tRNA U34 5-methylaminomethyl-2-thiouridine-forming methyltransferase MnmC
MDISIIKTADGSDSLFVKDLNEHYHSTHGAIQESRHVYIDAGLKHISSNNNSINILEIGFGTGLNALLSSIEAEGLKLKINYTTLEAYPLDMEIINKLNYADCVSGENQKEIFTTIHTCEWEKSIPISPFFNLHKIKNTLQEIEFTDTYNLIYFDAFAPNIQPEMWTEEVFTKLYSVLKPNGSIVTYCAKGEVKRTLKKVGFEVESLPGPPGKREMVRGNKK